MWCSGSANPQSPGSINLVEEPIAEVLDCEVPKLVDVITDGDHPGRHPTSTPATAQLTASCTPARADGVGQRSRSSRAPKGELSPAQKYSEQAPVRYPLHR